MKIVICGSRSQDEQIRECAGQLHNWFGDSIQINCPKDCDELPVSSKRLCFINWLRNADLVVILPKIITPYDVGEFIDIGESTSYELAIARCFDKQVIFWEPASHKNVIP